jgi:hypothetical protein
MFIAHEGKVSCIWIKARIEHLSARPSRKLGLSGKMRGGR